MKPSVSTHIVDKTKYFLMMVMSAIAVIWGYLFPGSLSMRSNLMILGIDIPIDAMLLFLLILSVTIILIGLMKEWTIRISSYLTFKSREILLLGSFLMILNAFTFNGFDFLGLFVYYYELVLIFSYTMISITLIPSILTAICGIIVLLIGILLNRRQTDIQIYKLRIKVNQSSNLLIVGVVIIVIAVLLVTIIQPEYVGAGIGTEDDRILRTIEHLPFTPTLTSVLVQFYLNQVVFLYPIVILIAGIFVLRWTLALPSHRITSKEFNIYFETVGPRYKRISYMLVLVMAIFVFLILGSIIVTWFLQLNPTNPLYQGQIFLFQNGAGLFGLSIILIVIQYFPRAIRPFLDSRIIRYAARRTLAIIPLFIGISIISYGLMASTGNPVDLIISRIPQGRNRDVVRENLMGIYGLNAPVQAQWFNWFVHFIMGDMGNSIIQGDSVAREISIRVMPTLELSIIPLSLAVLIAVPLGIYAALRQYSWQDNSIAIFVSFGLAVPIFLMIILLIIAFSFYIPLFPPAGRNLPYQSAPGVNLVYVKVYFQTFVETIIAWETWDAFFHLIIPIIAITSVSLALYVRLVRSGYLEVVQQDYILSAQAYGFDEKTIIFKHALRNVLIPIVTFLGLSIGGLLGGAPLTETTLSWPGLGAYGVVQILAYDYPVVMGLIMITALLILFSNLFTDLLYSVVDPRVAV